MSDERASVLTRAAELRDAFDRSFAEPLPSGPPLLIDLLAIRMGEERCALFLSEIAGLYADRKVTPVPGGAHALLGIAGFRGVIAPVYDLQVLLGYPAAEAARWLVMAARERAAFAFTTQEGQLRVSPEMIVSEQSGRPSRRHVRKFVRVAGGLHPIIDLSSVLEAVRRQVPENLDPGGN